MTPSSTPLVLGTLTSIRSRNVSLTTPSEMSLMFCSASSARKNGLNETICTIFLCVCACASAHAWHRRARAHPHAHKTETAASSAQRAEKKNCGTKAADVRPRAPAQARQSSKRSTRSGRAAKRARQAASFAPSASFRRRHARLLLRCKHCAKRQQPRRNKHNASTRCAARSLRPLVRATRAPSSARLCRALRRQNEDGPQSRLTRTGQNLARSFALAACPRQ